MEKKRRYVIIVLVAALLALTACQKNADADHSMESVNTPVTEVFSEERETVEVPSSPKEEGETAQGSEEAGEANEIEEIEETYLCSIPELDIELEIPARLYVYRTDGIRWDWNREWFRFSGCQLLLITEKEYPEDFWDSVTISDVQQEAGNIVFLLAITPKELSPINRLCENLFSGSNRLRVTEDWYCEIRSPYYLHMDDFSMYIVPEEERSVANYTAWVEEWEKTIQDHTEGTSSLNDQAEYLLTLMVTEYGTKTTMLNEAWWNAYCEAVEELKTNPEDYRYDDSEVQENMASVQETYTLYFETFNNRPIVDSSDCMTEIYVDQSEDIWLRAFYYANSVVICEGTDRKPIELADIMIIFQDWNRSQRSHTAFLSGELFSSSDFMVDLEPAYAYLQNLKEQSGNMSS